jgi:catechol 2,3-dioxygenase-like lactoylglutathione lyase family enzyme
MRRALAFLCGVCLAAAQAWAEPAVDVVRMIVIPVPNLDRAFAFYTGALSFEPTDPTEMPGIALQLGQQRVELVERAGRPVPEDSRSNDLWFQHLAIVVSDIDRAYAAVMRGGAVPNPAGPQELQNP